MYLIKKNQQTCASDNHDEINGGPVFNPVLQMFHHNFANDTRVLLCNFNQYELENMKNHPNSTHIPSWANLHCRSIIIIIIKKDAHVYIWSVEIVGVESSLWIVVCGDTGINFLSSSSHNWFKFKTLGTTLSPSF